MVHYANSIQNKDSFVPHFFNFLKKNWGGGVNNYLDIRIQSSYISLEPFAHFLEVVFAIAKRTVYLHAVTTQRVFQQVGICAGNPEVDHNTNS
jgi:hypothetical protein